MNLFHECAPPLAFERMDLLSNPLLCSWLQSVDRRERLYPELMNKTLRWVHDEGSPLRVDGFGTRAVAGWWSESPPSALHMESLRLFFELRGIKEWMLLHYSGDRTRDAIMFDAIEADTWTAEETPLVFEMRKKSGLSCGLFLDQRDNRHHVLTTARDRRVLNLFSYTGGFSVAAAIGGASHVTTVDLNKNYLEWSKTNFALNGVNGENHNFHAMDSFEFLKYARRKNLSYDLIVCDPPSFSRDKKGNVFRIDKDFSELLRACLAVLAESGDIIFCTNYEKWTSPEWLKQLRGALSPENVEITEKINFQWDFETHADRHMKSYLLAKK